MTSEGAAPQRRRQASGGPHAAAWEPTKEGASPPLTVSGCANVIHSVGTTLGSGLGPSWVSRWLASPVVPGAGAHVLLLSDDSADQPPHEVPQVWPGLGLPARSPPPRSPTPTKEEPTQARGGTSRLCARQSRRPGPHTRQAPERTGVGTAVAPRCSPLSVSSAQGTVPRQTERAGATGQARPQEGMRFGGLIRAPPAPALQPRQPRH